MTLEDMAKEHGWALIADTRDPYLTSFHKMLGGLPARLNIWHSEKASRMYTVGTCLTHPKQGKTQLFRRFCSLEEVGEYFKNPRKHSGKGYK